MQKQPVERIINKATKFLVSGISVEEQDDILSFKSNSKLFLDNIQDFLN